MTTDNDEPDLADILNDKFRVSSKDASLASHNIRLAGLYKDRERKSSKHEERRHQFLESQKKKRDQIVARFRSSLTTEDFEKVVDEVMICDEEDDEVFNISSSSTSSRLAGKRKHRHYRNILMLSEWMIDVPSDLIENWMLIVCPVGKRCLVVSSGGRTRVFARNGYEFLTSFSSCLPGGFSSSCRPTDNSMIDCIHDTKDGKSVFYVLDVILWNGLSFFGCDTDFRFYWLTSKFQEEIHDEKTFILLPRHKCDRQSISDGIKSSKETFPAEVDGLLFFHRQALYMSGITPLALWCKVDMLDDLFMEDDEKSAEEVVNQMEEKQQAETQIALCN